MAATLDLTGRTALVTGASSGLGAHFARVLARAGAQVVVGARRRDRVEQLAAEIGEAGGAALAVDLDVTRSDSIAAAFDAGASRRCAPENSRPPPVHYYRYLSKLKMNVRSIAEIYLFGGYAKNPFLWVSILLMDFAVVMLINEKLS